MKTLLSVLAAVLGASTSHASGIATRILECQPSRPELQAITLVHLEHSAPGGPVYRRNVFTHGELSVDVEPVGQGNDVLSFKVVSPDSGHVSFRSFQGGLVMNARIVDGQGRLRLDTTGWQALSGHRCVLGR